MNREDVIDVLSVVAAATRRTVGETDVAIWEGIIGELDKDLALRAVRDHLKHRPGVWLEPGHVYEGARVIRRLELDRETGAQREARQKALEAKAQPDVEELAMRKGLPDPDAPKFVRRPQPAEMKVRCPWCRASPGRLCVIPGTDTVLRRGFHPSRKDLVQVSS